MIHLCRFICISFFWTLQIPFVVHNTTHVRYILVTKFICGWCQAICSKLRCKMLEFPLCLPNIPNFWPVVYVCQHTLRWRHNDHAGVSNHQPHGCLLNRLFRRKSKKTSKLRVTGLCAGNSPGTGEFPAQMASYAENVSIWWRHHEEIAPTTYNFLLWVT